MHRALLALALVALVPTAHAGLPPTSRDAGVQCTAFHDSYRCVLRYPYEPAMEGRFVNALDISLRVHRGAAPFGVPPGYEPQPAPVIDVCPPLALCGPYPVEGDHWLYATWDLDASSGAVFGLREP